MTRAAPTFSLSGRSRRRSRTAPPRRQPRPAASAGCCSRRTSATCPRGRCAARANYSAARCKSHVVRGTRHNRLRGFARRRTRHGIPLGRLSKPGIVPWDPVREPKRLGYAVVLAVAAAGCCAGDLTATTEPRPLACDIADAAEASSSRPHPTPKSLGTILALRCLDVAGQHLDDGLGLRHRAWSRHTGDVFTASLRSFTARRAMASFGRLLPPLRCTWQTLPLRGPADPVAQVDNGGQTTTGDSPMNCHPASARPLARPGCNRGGTVTIEAQPLGQLLDREHIVHMEPRSTFREALLDVRLAVRRCKVIGRSSTITTKMPAARRPPARSLPGPRLPHRRRPRQQAEAPTRTSVRLQADGTQMDRRLRRAQGRSRPSTASAGRQGAIIVNTKVTTRPVE